MLKKTTIVLVMLMAASSHAKTCEQTLEACDFYVQQLEGLDNLQEQKIKAQASKIEALESEKQTWFFLCSDKVTCTLFGLVAGMVLWEVVR